MILQLIMIYQICNYKNTIFRITRHQNCKWFFCNDCTIWAVFSISATFINWAVFKNYLKAWWKDLKFIALLSFSFSTESLIINSSNKLFFSLDFSFNFRISDCEFLRFFSYFWFNLYIESFPSYCNFYVSFFIFFE